MMCAVMAARSGLSVTLFEKNEKLGKKLFITGKGRCNLTNASDLETVFDSIVSNRKFMYSSLYGFTNENAIEFFEELGLKTKIERGNRVFPVSDHSYDVIHALDKELRRLRVEVRLYEKVTSLIVDEGVCKGLITADGEEYYADAVVVATGGKSYESTGSTGDGYKFAKTLGLKIKDPTPALVPFNTKESFVKNLQGLSLKNTGLRLMKGKKELYSDFGEMLFTHFGVSGPMILSASARVAPSNFESELTLRLNLKPALTPEQLDERLIREFDESRSKQFKNSLGALFPSKLVPVMIERSGIDPSKRCAEISHEERSRLRELIQDFTMTVTGLRGFNEAIITKGGVSVKEIDPGTMEVKNCPHLYFIGEVLDLDAVTGGFNLQIAWSTAVACGRAIADNN